MNVGIHQHRMDTECSLKDLPEPMEDRDRWQENQGIERYQQAQLDDDDDELEWISWNEVWRPVIMEEKNYK